MHALPFLQSWTPTSQSDGWRNSPWWKPGNIQYNNTCLFNNGAWSVTSLWAGWLRFQGISRMCNVPPLSPTASIICFAVHAKKRHNIFELTHAHTYTCITHAHTPTHVHTHMHTPTHVHTHMIIHPHMCTHMHMHAYTHTCAHMHTPIHVHTHMHTQTRLSCWGRNITYVLVSCHGNTDVRASEEIFWVSSPSWDLRTNTHTYT